MVISLRFISCGTATNYESAAAWHDGARARVSINISTASARLRPLAGYTKNESIASDLTMLRRSILTGKPNTHFPCMSLVVSVWLVYPLYRSGPFLLELACEALAVDLEPVHYESCSYVRDSLVDKHMHVACSRKVWSLILLHRGLIEPPRAVRGHVTFVDDEIQDVTKIHE